MATSQQDHRKIAGQIIREARERKGFTQDQVVANTTVPTKSMLSDYENGKTGVGRSIHLPSLAAYLGLTEEEIRILNPNAVVNAAEPSGTPRPPRSRRMARTARNIAGDMSIPAAPEGQTNELTYDKEGASGLMVTEAGGRYWIWFSENVPSGHKILGSLQGWRIAAHPATPELR